MKLKSFLAVLLALSLFLFSFPLSVFAEELTPSQLGLNLEYMGSYGSTSLSNIPIGGLQRVAVGEDLIECYIPTAYIDNNGYNKVLVEKYGLFTHICDSKKTISIGAWDIVYSGCSVVGSSLNYSLEVFLDGVKVAGGQSSVSSTNPDDANFRYGFILCNINNEPYIWFIKRPINVFKNGRYQDDYNYYLLDCETDKPLSSIGDFDANDGTFLLRASAGGKTVNTEIDIGAGNQTPATVFFDSWTTCPNCGSHNISYKCSFLYSGVMVLTGQVGWVFKCRDCGASWKGITSNQEELDLFKKYMAEIDYSESLIEDSTLSPFVSTPSTVDLPSDVGGIGDYINQVFSALSSFTSSFNSFFSEVFAVLPAPVVGVILLGVGLVIIIGIIKAVRG